MFLILFILILQVMYFLLARVTYMIYKVIFETRPKEMKRMSTDKIKTVVVLGSGGHTTEMLMLLKNLNPERYSPRIYIMADTDTWSEQRVETFESSLHSGDVEKDYQIIKIPRSREVLQTYISSVITTIEAIIHSVPVMMKIKPDLILCNGPGTCIPICFIAFMMRAFFLSNNRIIFIESICRVKTLSLTGKILLFFADEILVQWPDLLEIYPRTKFIGRVY